MTICLLQRFPEEKRLPLLAEYFRALAESDDGETAFRQVFGLELAVFLTEYKSWWQNFVRQPVAFFYLGESQESGNDHAVRRELETVKDWLGRNLGSQLKGEYQVVLAPDEHVMAEALEKYTELPGSEAKHMAERSLCIENGGLLVLNAGHLQEAQQRAFSMGMYLAGVSRQAEVSGYKVEDYIRTARDNVRGRNLPRAAELRSEEDYRRAVEKYGEKEIASLTELAAYELINQHGWGSFARYLQETAKSKDGGQAFRRVYN